MARLKVFTWSDGFHSWTVATTSRAKALAAWGFKRDLFRDGSAREISEGEDYERALASPGELIERGLAVDVGQVTRAKKPKAAKSPPKKPGPSKADRERLAALQSEARALETQQGREGAELERRRAALEREADSLKARHARDRERLEGRLEKARARVEAAR